MRNGRTVARNQVAVTAATMRLTKLLSVMTNGVPEPIAWLSRARSRRPRQNDDCRDRLRRRRSCLLQPAEHADPGERAGVSTGWYTELVTTVPTIKDGYVYPMEGPGLGVELLPAVFERSDLTVRRSEA